MLHFIAPLQHLQAMKLVYLAFSCLVFFACLGYAQPSVDADARLDIGSDCDILADEADEKVCGDNPSVECMNEKAIHYTNHFRKCRGLAPLVPGTRAMLDNAIEHSETMERKGGDLFHQDLETVEFGPSQCRIKPRTSNALNGENVAWHTFGFGNNIPPPTNPAYACVLQWINSQGHRENILGLSEYSKNFKTVVIGIISTRPPFPTVVLVTHHFQLSE